MSAIEISAVLPAYNEARALPKLAEKLRAIFEEMGVSYEIIIVNDGSSDGTKEYVQDISRQDLRVKPIHLTRNFGKEAAMAAGLVSAEGKCVVFIDADLQHPPDLIPKMFAAWKEGNDVVNAVKRQYASESFFYRWFANRFNSMMSRMIGSNMAGASDYKLIDRQVVQVLLDCPERNRFFRGLVAWVGFQVANIEFDVVERELGKSKWSVISLIRYSLANIVAFSSFPLVALSYVGFATAALGFLLLIQTLTQYFLGRAAIGFTTVIAVQILLGGMILLALGVISMYLSKMYDEQKGRPLFIIQRPRHSTQNSEDRALDTSKE